MLYVQVTAGDIRNRNGGCPITNALTRAGLTGVSTGYTAIAADHGLRIANTPAARRFMRAYDTGKKVKPTLLPLGVVTQ